MIDSIDLQIGGTFHPPQKYRTKLDWLKSIPIAIYRIYRRNRSYFHLCFWALPQAEAGCSSWVAYVSWLVHHLEVAVVTGAV